ncbi:MAG: TIR domain-containing protein, partial [bacterium]|nr:TIR domain-containing protein [bacterium]
MSETRQAVFLSYASQDADAAQRMCAALARAGVEVWFDQSKLRGGDAWDAKIRKQIRECALFMPVISDSTQARAEGYFRLEWKLAVDRSHLVADDTAFLFPVVLDDVPDATARVPDKFREVQWTRLRPDDALDEFAANVAKLLGKEPEATNGKAEKAELSAPALAKSAQHRGKPAWTGWLLAAGLVFLGGAAWWAVTPRVPPAPTPAVSTDKSIAVLPFTNMSDDKDNAYFADGVHEDILTNLAHIAELKVISRTSVMQYRDSKKPLGQIAAELHAAYVLEGSVRRVGNVVRVTGQLIRAGTDEHVWAQAYDRELKDIFAIQAALALEIAGALQAAISPTQKNLLTRVPTKVPAAYDLLLRARGILNGYLNWDPDSTEKMRRVESLLRSAVELDPDFAVAWSYLADVHAQIYIFGVDQTAERLALARAALDKAVHLAPDDPDVIRTSGAFY